MDCVANNNNLIISFKYSIDNKKYKIEGKAKQKEKCNKVILSLFQKLEELSKTNLKELQNKPKETGYETIPISEFNINLDMIKKMLKLSEDSKILVFRFYQQRYRMFAIQSRECQSIIYIVGYDWDYSGYNHGS